MSEDDQEREKRRQGRFQTRDADLVADLPANRGNRSKSRDKCDKIFEKYSTIRDELNSAGDQFIAALGESISQYNLGGGNRKYEEKRRKCESLYYKARNYSLNAIASLQEDSVDQEISEYFTGKFLNTVSWLNDLYFKTYSYHLLSLDNTPSQEELDKRLKNLEDFAVKYEGRGVAEYARLLFPGILTSLASQGPINATPAPPSIHEPVHKSGSTPTETLLIRAEDPAARFTLDEAARVISALRRGKREYVAEKVSEPQVELPTSSTPLLESAPTLWDDRTDRNEHAPDFIKRVYAPWLGNGLTRSHIRALDPKLHKAFENWLSRPGNSMPDDLDLPSRQDVNDRIRRQIARGEPVGIHTTQEAHRIARMLQRPPNTSPGSE